MSVGGIYTISYSDCEMYRCSCTQGLRNRKIWPDSVSCNDLVIVCKSEHDHTEFLYPNGKLIHLLNCDFSITDGVLWIKF